MRRWAPATPASMLALILAFLLVRAGIGTPHSRPMDVRSDPAAFDPAACTVSVAAAPCHPVASRSPFLSWVHMRCFCHGVHEEIEAKCFNLT